MGTADELAIDVLINMLTTFSKDYVGIKTLVVGGQNASWPTPVKKKMEEMSDQQLERIRRLSRVAQNEVDATKASQPVIDDALDVESPIEPFLDDLIDFDASSL